MYPETMNVSERERERERERQRERSFKLLKILVPWKQKYESCPQTFVLAITDFRFSISENQRSWRKHSTNRVNVGRSEDFFGFTSIFFLTLAFPSSLYLQPRFPRLFMSEKKSGDHETKTGKKWVNYRAISPEK